MLLPALSDLAQTATGEPPSCRRRRPEETALYQVLLEHLETFLEKLEDGGRSLPRFVTIVLGAFLRTLFAWQRRRAKRLGFADGQGGAVTAVQRFGSALNLNPHLHSLAFDGVFLEPDEPDLPPRFVELPPPNDADIAQIVTAVRQRVERALNRAGYATQDHPTEPDPLALDEPVLAAAYAASVQSDLAFGPRAGQPIQRIGGSLGLPQVELRSRRCAHLKGFNLHADVAVNAGDRDRLENVCRYMCRGAIANERLQWLPDGQRLSYRLKKPWPEGTTHLTFDPLELIKKLCALVPVPQKNLIRYYGVLAPNARLRPLIVPRPEPTLPEPRPRRRPWAELMLRVLLINALACGNCGAQMAQIATITQPHVIKPFLDCIRLPSTPPTIKPARPPPEPQQDFNW